MQDFAVSSQCRQFNWNYFNFIIILIATYSEKMAKYDGTGNWLRNET